MLTPLTSGIKLNHIRVPKNPIFVFDYSCMVHQHVLETLEDVSCDSELIKNEQKTTIFLIFSSSFNRHLRNFFRTKVYLKRYGTIVTFKKRGVDVEKRAWVPGYHHFVAIM